MRNFSPRDKSIAICDEQAPEDGDLPQKCAEQFFEKSLQNWKYRLKSEKQCLESERNFATFLTCSLFLV